MEIRTDHPLKTLFYYRGGILKPGGVEMMIARQANWLKANTTIFPVVIIHQNNSELYNFFCRQEICVECVPESETVSLFRTAKYIHQLIDSTKGPRILQSHLFRESIVCRLVQFKTSGLLHYFRAETYIDCSEISRIKKWIYHILDYLTSAGVSHYLANGNLVAKEIEKKSFICKNKISTVYNGCERFGVLDIKTVQTPLKIAMVANLLPVKDHPTLFKALELCRIKGHEISVDIFGTELDCKPYLDFPSYKSYLEKQLEESGTRNQVFFRGFSDKLQEELKEFQIIILTSLSEGTANAIQEAMSVGKLIISSSVYELPYILDEGKCGLLFPAGDPDQLAKILIMVAEEPDSPRWSEMRRNAAERWETHFNTDSMMNRLNELYRKEYT